jgi:ribosomal protein L11 methyltransferase
MVSLFLDCTASEKDLISNTLWEAGTSGISERDLPAGRVELQAFFENEVPLASFSGKNLRWQAEAATDWVEVFKDSWQPFPVGDRFYLVPNWRDDAAPEGRIRLRIHPGRACGTGWHPATQLSLLALEEQVKTGDVVLDLGTGSGILAEAALLLGAKTVIACDIDTEAIAIAKVNLAHRLDAVALFAGSIRSMASDSVDFLIANINATAIVPMMQELRRVTRDRIALTGFPERDLPRVRAAMKSHFEETLEWEQDGWICLAACRN